MKLTAAEFRRRTSSTNRWSVHRGGVRGVAHPREQGCCPQEEGVVEPDGAEPDVAPTPPPDVVVVVFDPTRVDVVVVVGGTVVVVVDGRVGAVVVVVEGCGAVVVVGAGARVVVVVRGTVVVVVDVVVVVETGTAFGTK